MLLYLTSNQKSNLIDPAVRNMTLPAKKLVGRFSLKSFVTKDMRNYANAKFFVVDAACIEESGNDFTCSGARSLANRARSVSNITPA